LLTGFGTEAYNSQFAIFLDFSEGVRMKAFTATIVLAGLAVVPAASAQTSTASAPARTDAPAKVAVLNVQLAIASTAEGRQAQAELQSRFAPRRNELDNLGKQIEELQNRLRNGERTLSDDEKNRLAREGDQFSRQYQRKQQELQDDANDARNDLIERLGRKMIDVVNRYAGENGVAVVLDTSSQTTPVVYASNQVDITQEVIRLYDQAYPIKAQSTAPAAQPRPAAPKPAQPKPPQQ
jgi:outer membrane protein